MIDVSGWRERQLALDQKAENARKLGLGYGCAQCGADGGAALYCVTCAEKYVNKGTRMIEQRTEAWFLQRLGKATGSQIGNIIAKTKTGYSASRENYMAQLVVERLTNKPTEGFTNAAMQWGTETEPLARAAYEMARDLMVEEVGFVDHPVVYMSGASPDGLVGDDGLIEIKCPNTATHIDTILTQSVPSKYIPQIQWQLSCTNRLWCDFVSFDPRMPENLQLYIHRVEYNSDYVQMLIKEISVFLEEVDKKVNILRKFDVKNDV